MNAAQKRNQASSDPLPYVQVDRAVKPKAAMLADAIGVSRQHAIGSLIEWWDLCGDPRELERIVEKTPEGEEPAVVLTKEDAALRFRLASTRDVEPLTLVRIGLLEERTDGQFRVRGMSRFFEPIVRRIVGRESASKAGKASAEKRRQEYGTAQPRRTEARSTDVEPPPDDSRTPTERPSNAPRTPPEPHRTLAVSGQRSAVTDPSPTATEAPPPLQPLDANTAEAFWAKAQDYRAQLGAVRERPPGSLSSWWSRATGEVSGDIDRLWAGFVAYAADDHWRPKQAPWNGWLAQWERFVPPSSVARNVGEHDPVFRDVAQQAREVGLGDYPVRQLAEFRWRRNGSRLVGSHADGFFVQWCRDQWPQLARQPIDFEVAA